MELREMQKSGQAISFFRHLSQFMFSLEERRDFSFHSKGNILVMPKN